MKGGVRSRPIVPVVIIATLVVAVTGVVLALAGPSESNGPRTVQRLVRSITSFDGTALAAQVTVPAGSGWFPLVVLPASYGADWHEYAAVARHLTSNGFVTVSYTQRGFHDSGGRVDLAGAATQHDARIVIDWALRHTPADPDHVGMLGVSYGAGISLLTAAHDRRVRAVVALSAWTDLARALRPDGVANANADRALLTNRRLDAATARLRDPNLTAGQLHAFTRTRSPRTYVAALNRNRPAILLGNGWQDSLFAPSTLITFYDELRTPKRLQLAVGGHAGPERGMLDGRRNATGAAAYAWLAHYLRGADNGVQRSPAVRLEDVTTKRVTGYDTWPSSRTTLTSLASPTSMRAGPWRAGLRVSHQPPSHIRLGRAVAGEHYRPPTMIIQQTSDHLLVWRQPPLRAALHVLGSFRLSFGASAPTRTALIASVYDVDAAGTGSLMASGPAEVGADSTVTMSLEPIDWTLPAGHHLAVTIGTSSPRWTQTASPGAGVTLSSTIVHPAELGVPVA